MPGLTVKSGNWKNLFKTWGLGNYQRTCEYILGVEYLKIIYIPILSGFFELKTIILSQL